MSTCLITGSSGLVGSECARHFDALGWIVYGADNNARKKFFGPDGDTTPNLERLRQDCDDFRSRRVDVSDFVGVCNLIIEADPELIIHAAAQPSHDWAATDPLYDFEVNARGTLNLLEATRQFAPNAVFCYLSTNKVYGDRPNQAVVNELATRYELRSDSWVCDPELGFSEWLSVDESTHSLFGCSKLAADLYVQEYGRYFGLKTVSFRCGCLTGGAHAGTEQHGFLAYLAKCCKEGRPYTVYGYKGKQVRDQLHAHDVARACEEFVKSPRLGEVYNLGGGRANSVSVLEAIALVEIATRKELQWTYCEEPRKGDHKVWITDTTKFRSDYPDWSVRCSLPAIISDLCGDPVCLTNPTQSVL